MITWLFNGVFKIVSYVISWVFTAITAVLPVFPNLSTYADNINLFWDKVFSFFGHYRSIFLIDSHHITLIILILTVKFTYKPTIYFIKLVIKWYDKLKL